MRRNEGQGHNALDGVQANVIVGPGRGGAKNGKSDRLAFRECFFNCSCDWRARPIYFASRDVRWRESCLPGRAQGVRLSRTMMGKDIPASSVVAWQQMPRSRGREQGAGEWRSLPCRCHVEHPMTDEMNAIGVALQFTIENIHRKFAFDVTFSLLWNSSRCKLHSSTCDAAHGCGITLPLKVAG